MKNTTPITGTVARASAAVKVAALPELGEGVVECLPTIFNVEYRMGWMTWHNLLPGAFDASLAAQESIPTFWAHAWDWSEQTPIGHSLEASADETAVRLVNQLYIEDSETARSVYRGLVAGALREWSIGYRILEYKARDDAEDKTVIDVITAELWEASVVLRGANPETETLKVASALAGADATPAALRRALAGLIDELGVDVTADPALKDVRPPAAQLGKGDLAALLDVDEQALDNLAALLKSGIDLAGLLAGQEELLEPEPFQPDPERLAALLRNQSARRALAPHS